MNHNSAYALNSLGWRKLYSGSIDEAIPLVEQAIRLSPRDPLIASFYNMIGTAYLVHSHTDEAIVWYERARKASRQVYRSFAAASPPPMPSGAKPNEPPVSLPKRVG